jgi:hypothetical protein
MMMMANTVSSLFPHPELTLLAHNNDDKPNYASLKILHKEMNANVMSIPSTRGRGAHDHLIAVLSNVAYVALTQVVFDVPVHPVDAPQHADGATIGQITEVN